MLRLPGYGYASPRLYPDNLRSIYWIPMPLGAQLALPGKIVLSISPGAADVSRFAMALYGIAPHEAYQYYETASRVIRRLTSAGGIFPWWQGGGGPFRHTARPALCECCQRMLSGDARGPFGGASAMRMRCGCCARPGAGAFHFPRWPGAHILRLHPQSQCPGKRPRWPCPSAP